MHHAGDKGGASMMYLVMIVRTVRRDEDIYKCETVNLDSVKASINISEGVWIMCSSASACA